MSPRDPVSDEVALQQPHRSRLVLPVPERDADLDALIVHELTHLLFCGIILAEQSGDGGLPRWVHEGIAHYMVGAFRVPVEGRRNGRE